MSESILGNTPVTVAIFKNCKKTRNCQKEGGGMRRSLSLRQKSDQLRKLFSEQNGWNKGIFTQNVKWDLTLIFLRDVGL